MLVDLQALVNVGRSRAIIALSSDRRSPLLARRPDSGQRSTTGIWAWPRSGTEH